MLFQFHILKNFSRKFSHLTPLVYRSRHWFVLRNSCSVLRIDRLIKFITHLITSAQHTMSLSTRSSSWNGSKLNNPSFFFLLSNTASSTLFNCFLVHSPSDLQLMDGCDQHAGADRHKSLKQHMLFRSELKLVSVIKKWKSDSRLHWEVKWHKKEFSWTRKLSLVRSVWIYWRIR